MKRLTRWAAPVALAAALLALAAPAMASAAPFGLEQEGKAVKPGSIVELKSTRPFDVESSALGTVPCQTVRLDGEVVLNEEAQEVGKGHSKHIAAPFKVFEGGTSEMATCGRAGAEVKAFGVELNELYSAGGVSAETGEKSPTAAFGFRWELTPGGPVCSYSSGPANWTFVPGTNVLKLNRVLGAVSPHNPFCGGSEVHFSGEFAVFSGGKPVILN